MLCSYKQRGAEAEAADNVFHHLTYEGAASDIDALTDPRERAALEAQAGIHKHDACHVQLLVSLTNEAGGRQSICRVAVASSGHCLSSWSVQMCHCR